MKRNVKILGKQQAEEVVELANAAEQQILQEMKKYMLKRFYEKIRNKI